MRILWVHTVYQAVFLALGVGTGVLSSLLLTESSWGRRDIQNILIE